MQDRKGTSIAREGKPKEDPVGPSQSGYQGRDGDRGKASVPCCGVSSLKESTSANVGAPHFSRENTRHEEEPQGMERQKTTLFSVVESRADVSMA